MSELLQYLVAGIGLGSVYALVALGFVVIYRASQVFNFAHGELLSFGALLMVWMSAPPADPDAALGLGAPEVSGLGLPWGLALVLAIGATGVLAALIERIALRPLVGRPVFVPIIITLFIGFLLRTGLILAFGAGPMPLRTPWDPMARFDVGGAAIDYSAASVIGATAVALIAFFALLRFSRLGIAMRATAGDQEASLGVGIPVGRIFGASWFIAGAFAALAGIFLGMFPRNVDANLGFVALRAFPAVIVGGLESPTGAVIAGLLLGVLEVLTAGYVNDSFGEMSKNFHAVLPYLVMIGVLVVRPYGLFGRRRVERL
ncbi:MAG: branched-chain amino acid ABC transporter permease [Myxococcales bacterium]|nr:branched-chain amino acid ABC transporter permease [Myxococcales bacterium]